MQITDHDEWFSQHSWIESSSYSKYSGAEPTLISLFSWARERRRISSQIHFVNKDIERMLRNMVDAGRFLADPTIAIS